jgi:hypothetical protein
VERSSQHVLPYQKVQWYFELAEPLVPALDFFNAFLHETFGLVWHYPVHCCVVCTRAGSRWRISDSHLVVCKYSSTGGKRPQRKREKTNSNASLYSTRCFSSFHRRFLRESDRCNVFLVVDDSPTLHCASSSAEKVVHLLF